MKDFWGKWKNWASLIPPEEAIYPDPWHMFDDLKLCEQAASLFRHDPRAKDGIRFECFNKKEADKLKKIMDSLYPDVKVYFEYPKKIG